MPRNVAIAIGVNHYQYENPLKFAGDDAKAMQSYLNRIGFEEVVLYSDDTPGHHPELTNLLIGIDRIADNVRLGKDDSFWFFFSGHGGRQGGRDYLLPTNGYSQNLRRSAIAIEDVVRALTQCGAGNLVMILDACRNVIPEHGKGSHQTIELVKQAGIITLFSCKPGQKSYELPDVQRGAFTHGLLQALEGEYHPHRCNVLQLSEYLRQIVPTLVAEKLKAQQSPYFIAEPVEKATQMLLPLPQKPKPEPVIPVEPKSESVSGKAVGNHVAALIRDAVRATQRQEWAEAKRLWEQVLIEAHDPEDRKLALEQRDYVSSQQLVSAQGDLTQIYQENLGQYRTAFQRAVGDKYPLDEFVRSTLDNQWRFWQLEESDIKGIEKSILENAEAEYQSQLQAAEDERKQREAQAERQRLEVIGERERRKQEEANRRAKNEQPKSFVEDLGNGVKLEMILIPKGSFLMGTAGGIGNLVKGLIKYEDYSREQPRHQVNITEPFYLGKFQVTQGQWQVVMGNNPSKFQNGNDYPVENVSWDDCHEFLEKLNQKTGKRYRLPSEAEWEYACRAGSTSRYYFGDDEKQLGAYAWFSGNSGSTSHPVGQKKPNQFGLYDMHGNVWERCEDSWEGNHSWEGNYKQSKTQQPFVNSSGCKVKRGGAWDVDPRDCRSAYRYLSSRDGRYRSLGFRVACSPQGLP